MRIIDIGLRDFLSFDDFQKSRVDPSLNVIVGPNGAGKSNLGRAILAARDILNLAEGRRWDWSSAHRLGAVSSSYQIQIRFDLTEEWEMDLMASFVRALLASAPILSPPSPRDPQRLAVGEDEFAQWVDTQVTRGKVQSLFSGTLKVEHTAEPVDHWDISYSFKHNGEAYEWVVESSKRQSLLSRIAVDPTQPKENTQYFMFLDRYFDKEKGGFVSEGFLLEHMLPKENAAYYQYEVRFQGGSKSMSRPVIDFGILLGIDFSETSRSYGLIDVLAQILHRALVSSSDMRVSPQTLYSADEVQLPTEAIDLREGEAAPLYLFRMKNGNEQERATFHKIVETYRSLTGDEVDVEFEARQPRGQENRAWSIQPVVQKTQGSVPLAHSGAGAWECLLLSIYLETQSASVTIMDEPAMNLHPSLQRKFLSLARSRSTQAIVITHSPYLIPCDTLEDLRRISRFRLVQGVTRSSSLADSEIERDFGKDASRLLKELRGTPEVAAMMFAQAVILLEGETELGAIPVWFEKGKTASAKGSLEDLNISIISVGGDKSFGTLAHFASSFNVPWAILCDGAGVQNGRVLKQLDYPDVPDETWDSFDSSREFCAGKGIFTLSSRASEEFEDLPYVSPSLQDAKASYGRSKVRQGRHVAMSTDCPNPVDDLYAKILSYFALH